ncbi:UDP-2,3-diacylglucosamine diphosphatase [Derxia gummosa]|uniref:UDP-2,3-diacylglucosamine hydrolase n=1 Tax=Derxia gummosa DSM 723 TaxID=1121388 RepID=A0A8B6X8K0_9BURK|nr:UDP-2,3-diacylglucosamine diphosphatase [Derxia gummosa]
MAGRLNHLRFDGRRPVRIVSDLHLWGDRPATLARFEHCIERARADAAALLILGDLFEYWVGDDDLGSADIAPAARALKAATDAGLTVGFLPGNRDFLIGRRFARATGVTLLADEVALDVGGFRAWLMHGDTLCTDDVGYQRFRRITRLPGLAWVWNHTALAWRHERIAAMRRASKQRKRSTGLQAWMDATPPAIAAAFATAARRLPGCITLIHGHTHRPAVHDEGDGRRRWVLPDWEFDGTPEPRGGGVEITPEGVRWFSA